MNFVGQGALKLSKNKITDKGEKNIFFTEKKTFIEILL